MSTFSFHWATLVMFLGLSLFLALSVSWWQGNETILQLSQHIYQLQLNPPWFVQVPAENHRLLLKGIFIVLAILIFSIVHYFPQSPRWAKVVVTGILMAFSLRYVLWRVLATLNLSDAPSGLLALAFLALEIPFTLLGLPQLFWAAGVKNHSRAADRYEALIKAGDYLPSVDIFIPTYNESVSILRRTIIGCQALDYGDKTIYLLDDGRRSPVESLAKELGCNYIIRGDRINYKAGNLNHALPLTEGELIAVFDADFVPTRNFLQRTVGFFQRPQIGLVQSHQNFYNPDAIVRNLGLAQQLTNNRESFSRYIQPINSSVGATICDGSAFVVRRRDLEAIGGFVTESLSEDYFTGIMLESRHQRVIYLDENLSAGLAAEKLNDYIGQYQRWLMGSLQAFFIPANPLTIAGLTLRQRIAHLSNLAFWLTSFPRLLTLLIPIICGLAYVFPVIITPDEWLYFLFLPQFLLLLALHWLSGRSSSFFLSEVYTVVHAIPFSWAVVQTLIRPFARGFIVTPKSFLSSRFQVNFWLTIPLGLLWLGNGLTLVKFLWERHAPTAMIPTAFADLSEGTVGILIFWWIYNLVILTLAIWACIDPPKTDDYHWFKLTKPVQLRWQDNQVPGSTQLISEQGVRVQLGTIPNPRLAPGDDVEMDIQINEWPGSITLKAQVSRVVTHNDHRSAPMIDLQFVAVTPSQYRHLVHLLFCRPGQWFRRSHPNELQTLFVLLHRLVRPRFWQQTDKVIDAIPIR
ncbi:MAG: glycosyltransferase [Synechocystis sp.]|nr:glycosyltransferase [Synechocystis sp.]